MQSALRIDRIYRETKFFPYLEKARGIWYEQIIAQKENTFLWIPVLLALGIALYFSLPFEPPMIMANLVFLLSFTGYYLSLPYSRLQPLFLAIMTFYFGSWDGE